MSYHLTIVDEPSYVHATVTGTHSPENARRFLAEAHEACARRNCTAVLLEMNLSGPSLSTSSIFEVVAERIPSALIFERIAYVDASSERDPLQKKFAETVAVNRGLGVRSFRNVADAKRWLRESAIED